MKISLLDYGAGNVRSVRNAIIGVGYGNDIEDITTAEQILNAECIIFPGVGSFQTAMHVLQDRNFLEPLKLYLQSRKRPLKLYLQSRKRPFLGICLGMQTLFESSEEIGHQHTLRDGEPYEISCKTTIPGLGVIPGHVVKFDESKCAVPHIGWNGRIIHQDSPVLASVGPDAETYFVHSYYAEITEKNKDWVLTSTLYGDQYFVSSIQKECVVATQFHPEKSGATGLRILKNFLDSAVNGTLCNAKPIVVDSAMRTQLTKRIVVALDVRSNDFGDLVVTKGDQYDVREKSDSANGKGGVRNLGLPVALAQRYYDEGADEIAFLNITSFRHGVLEDMPMLQVLEEASKNIFVPLTVGGGIRSYTDPDTNRTWSALEVASRYFRAGADKVSLGSDAVHAAEAYVASGGRKTGMTAIEMISNIYGVQAVVVSIDPKRIYVQNPVEMSNESRVVIPLSENDAVGPNGELHCWYQCTVKGGREARDICAVTVAKTCEQLGAGEIMLNCIDMDGQGRGYDHTLMNAVSNVVTIPVIASSGAGVPQHFTDVFTKTKVQGALAAGMFHRKEVEIEAVKQHMRDHGIAARRS